MINVVCFGDSITEGAEFPVEERWTSLLQARLDAHSPGCYRVYNRGIGGNTMAQGFDRFYSDVIPLLPGILLIQFGFNDANIKDFSIITRVSLAEFERNLREFHRITITANGLPVFILNHSIGPVDGKQGNGKSYNDNYADYADVIIQVAKNCQAHLIDLPAQLLARGVKIRDFVADDQIHLSHTANNDYAETLFDELVNLEPEVILN